MWCDSPPPPPSPYVQPTVAYPGGSLHYLVMENMLLRIRAGTADENCLIRSGSQELLFRHPLRWYWLRLYICAYICVSTSPNPSPPPPTYTHYLVLKSILLRIRPGTAKENCLIRSGSRELFWHPLRWYWLRLIYLCVHLLVIERLRNENEDKTKTQMTQSFNQYSENETKIWHQNIINQFNRVSSSSLRSHFVIFLINARTMTKRKDCASSKSSQSKKHLVCLNTT